MKNYLYGMIALVFFLFSCSKDLKEVMSTKSSEEGVLRYSLAIGGENREFLLYVPSSYSGGSHMPVMLNFHGLVSNAKAHMLGVSDMRELAEREGFILVYPEGTVVNGYSHWNVGNSYGISTADDVQFVDALIDFLASNYQIDLDRIYSCGFSNGGFFSFELSCLLSNRIAAMGSVSGLMYSERINNCEASRPVPVLTIHGTTDETVKYEGGYPGDVHSVESVSAYWAEHNGAKVTPSKNVLPNINKDDNSYVECYQYKNYDDNAVVVHYKVINGGHSWPSLNANPTTTNLDIDANQIIWDFVSQYDINGRLD